MYRPPNLSAYEAWLKDEGYQESTIEVTLRHIKTVFSRRNKTVDPSRVAHVRRYLRFVAKTRKNPLGKKFVNRMLKAGLEPASEIQKHGKRSKANLTKKEWSTLRAKLRRGDEISRMLVAYMQSPYRISEFLNLRSFKVTEDDINDKISREWIANARAGNVKLFQILCNTERCAYYRIRRRLQMVCKALELETDLDTLYKSYHEIENEAA